MPTMWQRDLAADRDRLVAWLQRQLPHARDIALTDLVLAPVMPSVTARSGGTIYPIVQSIPPLYGSYPHECYGAYDAEPEHFTTYVDGILARGAVAVADYLERYVYAPSAHADYLALFGDARRAGAADRARMLTT